MHSPRNPRARFRRKSVLRLGYALALAALVGAAPALRAQQAPPDRIQLNQYLDCSPCCRRRFRPTDRRSSTAGVGWTR